MNTNNFKKTRIACAVSLLLAGTAMTSAFAEEAAVTDQADEATEVILVKGIRGSLMRAADIKREAHGVVDAISAEEMGKFPDTNLAESLQRITGVSVSRANGEGSKITVRGFGPAFNLVTLNGRQMPATGYSRSYSLENLSSEGVSSLELHKTATADLPTGGLGATVNIVTAKPLDNPGQRFSVMAKGIHDTSNENGDDITPEVSAIYSNTFMDDRLGVSFTLSHQQRDFQQQHAYMQGWVRQTDDDLPTLSEEDFIDNRTTTDGYLWLPKDMHYGFTDTEREKTNAQFTVQFIPVEGLVATLDYTYTDALTESSKVGWGIWNNFGSNLLSFELDENGTAVYADIAGNDSSVSQTQTYSDVEAKSIGLNLQWQINDDWEVALDYHNSTNESVEGTAQMILGSDELSSKEYDYRSGEIPQFSVNWNNGSNTLEASEIDSNFGQFIHTPGETEIEQIQFDATWYSTFNTPLVSIKAGLAYTEMESAGTSAWSGLRGGAYLGGYEAVMPDSMFTRHGTGGFLDAFNGGGSDLQTDYYYTFDFDEMIARHEAYFTEDEVGSNYFSTDPYFDGTDSDETVYEDTFAIYASSAWEFDISDYLLTMNVGFRYERTDAESKVLQDVEEQVVWASPSEWIMKYEDGDQTFYSEEGDYSMFLPMLDLKLDITDDLVARFSAGKTMSRAPLAYLAGGQSLSGSPKPGARNGSKGNTNLQPFDSVNIDVTLEYYYDDANYAAIGWFKKDVDNFIVIEESLQTVDGLYDVYGGQRYNLAYNELVSEGVTPTENDIYWWLIDNGYGNSDNEIEPDSATDELIEWTIEEPVNSNSKTVDGFEVAIQHLFGESGFGFGANATFVDGDVEYDPTIVGTQAPLEGLSDSANLQGFYEKHGLSAKVTYAWRDSYYAGMGQDQGSANEPQQVKEFGQIDVSINYDITEQLTVFFEGINLNDETEQGYGRYEEQFMYARQYGPRYALGVRYGFN
ncbi:TonB-dependent receptor [Neiella marina]|uniref:TonB-dependent receptor n=1 Tax=Neiella holothuriorum TaxID=2870530 RepID=A0ABS7EE56_9GAMM|nr:TonB-dependent receptor [Neiella holothuriorum]MBW8190603.1 TonB-dependent receptor [Neiella holothuriorum]